MLVAGGRQPARIFRFIASGVFGKAALGGGAGMVAWGLLFHYGITLLFTLAFFLTYSRIGSLGRHRYAAGILYGLAVWIIMNLLIVPLSRTPKFPFHPPQALIGALILVLAVGLPISLLAHRLLGPRKKGARSKKGVDGVYLIPFFTGAVIISVAYSCNPYVEKKDIFGFNPEPGKTFHIVILRESAYRRDSSADIGLDAAYAWNDFKHTDTLQLKLSVQTMETNGSHSILKLTFKNIEMSRPRIKVSFDWDGFLHLFNGHSMYAGLDRNGMVQYLYYGDDIKGSVAQAVHVDHYTITALTEDFIGKEAMKDLLNRFFSSVPGNRVVANDNWQSTIFITTKAPVKVNSLYTLGERSKDTVHVGMEGIISAQTGPGGSLYLTGTQRGTETLSYLTGVPYRYEITTNSVYTAGHDKWLYTDHFLFSRSPGEP
jgi:Family of unknown function (DUF6263)